MFKLIKIDGTSMSPEYNSGDFLIIRKVLRTHLIKKGKNILIDHSKYGRIIKKVIYKDIINQSFTVGGNNSSSTSISKLGSIHFSQVIGVPIFHFSK